MDKRRSLDRALDGIKPGMVVAVGGFGGAGFPARLVAEVERRHLSGLTLVSNNAARFESLAATGAISRIICSFPFGGAAPTLRGTLEAAGVELELVPQGTLAERLRAAGAGLGGVLTRVGMGTELTTGRRRVEVAGAEYLLEPALAADFALVAALRADRWGNLSMRGTARNFNLVMAMAATTTVAETPSVVALGAISPDRCDVPGIFVDAVVEIAGSSKTREESRGVDA